MKVHKIKEEHEIISVEWIPKIFGITEEELCCAFDERFDQNSDPEHTLQEIDVVYPLKDAVQLAIEQSPGNYAVKKVNDWRVKVIELEEEKEVDWI